MSKPLMLSGRCPETPMLFDLPQARKPPSLVVARIDCERLRGFIALHGYSSISENSPLFNPVIMENF